MKKIGLMNHFQHLKTILHKHEMLALSIYTAFAMVLSRILLYASYLAGALANNVNAKDLRSFLNALNIWDAVWYRSIVETGYDIKPLLSGINYSNTAFFPVMPYFYKLISLFFSESTESLYIWGSILNTVIFAVSLYIAGKYILLTRKSLWQAFVFISFMSFGIYSFYYSIFYTEAFFFLLLVLNFYFMHTKKYILAGIAGLLCSATRNLGIFLVFPMLLQFMMQYAHSEEMESCTHSGVFHRKVLYLRSFIKHLFRSERFLLGICLVPAGFFSYMLYLKLRFNDGFAFLHVQKAWFRGYTGLWNTIKGTVSLEGIQFYYFCIIFMALISIYLLFCKKQYHEFVYAVIYLYIPMSYGGTYSLARYISAGFLYFLGFTDLLKKNNKFITVLLLIAFAMFEWQFVQIWCFGDSTVLN